VKVKVCGITSYEDAVLALEQGVDALGFNFYRPSPRYIDPAKVREIIRRLPPLWVSVGLFVNAAIDELREVSRVAGVQVLQLHGDETPDYCRRVSEWPLLKAIRIGAEPVREDLRQYPVQAFVLDVKDDSLFGGTGKSFNWRFAEGIDHPVVLAGGLRPDNVREAILTVNPYGVDVCSGVESSPGKKAPGLLAQFMNEVRNVGRI
jgi:phosphoribosylanthranilate isomerase